MAERHPREAALRRVHGPGALFAAAYGNVGSSIYYALGLVALYALGLTPVTFLIAGLIFAFTAATYVEATVLYPEAGGSSSFARHAFNEFASFLAGWAQMLTYIVTAAISAFFVPHYLAVFWEPLGHGPADVFFGIGLLVAPRGAQRQGDRGVGAAQPGARDRRPRHPGGAGGDRLRARPRPGPARQPGPARHRADAGATSRSGSRSGWSPTPGSRRSRTCPRRRGHRTARSRAAPPPSSSRWSASTRFLPAIALSAMPVTEDAGGDFTTELGTTFADDPVLGIVENLGLVGGARRRAPRLRRRARRGDPADRHQRGADRALAADVLDGPAPPAAGDPARRSTRGSRRRTWRSSSSPRSPRSSWRRARPRSWGRSTPSARRSRSPSPTSR